MADTDTIGAQLKAMRERSGLSLRDLAKRSGYSQASSLQRYFDEGYDRARLPVEIAERLIKGFEGRIAADEIMRLTGLPALPEAKPFRMEGASAERMRRDVPVYGTALGAPAEIDGSDIEQTSLDAHEVITYFKRPVVLDGRTDVYGIFIQGSSMYPRFSEGETAFIDPKRPPMVGDDVIVYLKMPDEHEGDRVSAVLIKRLVRRSASHIELEQFNPATTFRIPRERYGEVHRVIPWAELLS